MALAGQRPPDKSPTDEKDLVKNMKPARREYLLYLPLYNGVEEVKIGIPHDAKLEEAPPRRRDRSPFCSTALQLFRAGAPPARGWLTRQSWAGAWTGHT